MTTNDMSSTAQEILFVPRAVAIIIDSVLVSVFQGILFSIVPMLFVGLGPLVGIAIWVGYNTFMFTWKWQATVGKRIMGVYVTDDAGNKLDPKTAVIRSLMMYVSGLILFIGYLMPFFRPDKKTLHDLVAKTKVVQGKIGDGPI